MSKIFLCTLLVLTSLGLAINDATARGFSSTRGFGMMRSKNIFTHTTPRAQKSASTTKRMQNNRFKGLFSGLLIGSFLTSLFMGHGFGGAILSWFMLGMTIYFIVNIMRRRK